MIEVKDLDYSYKKDKIILKKVCFDAGKGMCTAVLGNNGAGKSTLIKCLNRILKPMEGTVCINGKNVSNLKSNDIAKLMSYVSQHSTGEQFTVFDTVLLGRKPYIKLQVTSNDIEIVESVIEKMGLTDKTLRYVDELSGGERQKVMLARALAQQPQVLLLDEPTSNLDLYNQYEVLKNVKEIAVQENMTVIIVMHDLNLALRYCDRFMLVKDGTIYDYGGRDIMTPDNICNVYGIPVAIEDIHGIPVVIPLPA